MDFFLNQNDPKSILIYSLIVLWSIIWKGLALWIASRRDSRIWFVVILIFSTLGILEIVYLFFVLKLKPHDLLTKDGVGSEVKK